MEAGGLPSTNGVVGHNRVVPCQEYVPTQELVNGNHPARNGPRGHQVRDGYDAGYYLDAAGQGHAELGPPKEDLTALHERVQGSEPGRGHVVLPGKLLARVVTVGGYCESAGAL